jgi:GNAT superfamily N-acetyltransferase
MQIRNARPVDAFDVAMVHVTAWQVAYRGILSDEYLEGLRAEDRALKYDFSCADPMKPHTIVGIDDGRVAGFATTCAARDCDLKDAGELTALYVDPRCWGRGVGASLITAARLRLKNLGFQKACLWLLDGNARGGRFYQKDGWAPDGCKRIDTIWGITVNETRYQRDI